MLHWNVYLSGDIKSEWREEIADAIALDGLPVRLFSPVCDHDTRDSVGSRILGDESDDFWRDHKSAKINAIRNHNLMRKADIVVVRFGDEFAQWNWAFDVGFAAALGKSIIIIHEGELSHSLKDLDAIAQAVARSPRQVADILRYVITEA